MKKGTFSKVLLSLISLVFVGTEAQAQLPDCNAANLIYMHSGNNIYNIDPLAPIVPGVNPALNTIPMTGAGLAVSENINGPGPTPTFYVTVGSIYHYWDGTMWVSTGHSSGPAAAVNPGAGGGYIYNLIGASGEVWRYDGTGPAILIVTIPTFNGGGPYDLVADCVGNFYILNTSNPNQSLQKYDPNGNLLQQWTLTGAPSSGAGGGMAIIGNTVYYHNGGGYMGGTIGTTNVAFSPMPQPLTPSPSDFASCPLGGVNSVGIHDTLDYCDPMPVTLTSTGTGPFTWVVVSGGGVVNGNGQTVTATTSGPTVITVTSTATCGLKTDTFTIFEPPSTTLTSDTIFNCGNIPVTINAAGTPPYTWSVLNGPAMITGSGPTISVTTSATSQIIAGSMATCGPVYDTVTLLVPTAIVDAGPDQTIYGCATYAGSLNGTVTNVTPGLNYSYNWTPAGSIVSGGTTLTPAIAPTTNTTYTLTVSVPASQGGCTWTDDVTVTVSDATVTADFTMEVRLGCEGDTVIFTNLSTQATNYNWNFGDGMSSTDPNPMHIYAAQGTYTVTLDASNPYCNATVSKPVTFDHPLDAAFTFTKDSICNGETINFTNTSVGSSGYTYAWDFGDGTTSTDFNASHAFTTDGIFPVTLTIQDFVPCQSIETHNIVVGSIRVDAGPKDTTACLADSMLISAFVTAPPYFSSFSYAWSPAENIGSTNTPETNFYTTVPGDYYYTVTVTGYPMGCVATDTMHVFIQPKPILINVSPNQVVEYGTKVQLNAEGVRYYIWTPSKTLDNPNIHNPVALPEEPTTIYTVIGMNEHGGCRDTAWVQVDLTYTDEFIPSAFSPNGDGRNDVFRVVGLKYQKVIEFRVFNRWGNELFSSQDGTSGWDGTYNGERQDAGVYSYLVRVSLPNGETRTYKGDVTLIR